MKSADIPRLLKESGAAPEATTFGLTAALSSLYLLLAFASLIQWDGSPVWARVDWFSGSYLGLRTLGAIHSLASSRRAFRSDRMRREWWGLTSKPAAGKWAIPLMLGELAVFLDYGHWHTGVLLNWPILRGLGLALYVVAAAWQMWTDVYLARFFGSERPPREPLSEGPFRYVRHPRYAAAMLAKAALALIFASLVGWLLWVAWTFVLVRTVEAEELHLRRRFGTKYENYAHGTARLLPRIY